MTAASPHAPQYIRKPSCSLGGLVGVQSHQTHSQEPCSTQGHPSPLEMLRLDAAVRHTLGPGGQAAAPGPPPPWPLKLLLLSPTHTSKSSTFMTLLMALMAASRSERARGSSQQWSACRKHRKRI